MLQKIQEILLNNPRHTFGIIILILAIATLILTTVSMIRRHRNEKFDYEELKKGVNDDLKKRGMEEIT